MFAFTITLLAATLVASILFFSKWKSNTFANKLVKYTFLGIILVSLSCLLNEAGLTDKIAIQTQTFLWFITIWFGILGISWNNSGKWNMFCKITLIIIALSSASWLYI